MIHTRTRNNQRVHKRNVEKKKSAKGGGGGRGPDWQMKCEGHSTHTEREDARGIQV